MISPVDSSILATASLSLVHIPSPSVLSKVVVPFEHKACVPLNTPALRGDFIVTASVAMELAQPPKPATV